MQKSEIKQLQKSIMGDEYNEAVIDAAIEIASAVDKEPAVIRLFGQSYLDDVVTCLKALRAGRESFRSRMMLQDFVCRLQHGITDAQKSIKRLDQIKRHKRLPSLTQSQKQDIYDDERKHALLRPSSMRLRTHNF
tara:strand:- start:154 stop:558 length:405 start_codon:yes stop_codon:yes gene_type:complete